MKARPSKRLYDHCPITIEPIQLDNLDQSIATCASISILHPHFDVVIGKPRLTAASFPTTPVEPLLASNPGSAQRLQPRSPATPRHAQS